MDELRTITRMVSPIPRDSPVPTRDTDADDEFKESESEKSDSWWRVVLDLSLYKKRWPVCLVQQMIFFRFLYFQQVPCVVLSGTFPLVWNQYRNRNLFSLMSHIVVWYLHYYDDEFLEIGYDNFQHSESGQFFLEPLCLISLDLDERLPLLSCPFILKNCLCKKPTAFNTVKC